MNDRHRRRFWIKVQLSGNAQAEEATTIIQRWKTQHQAAGQLVRAIRLYATLCQGDVNVLNDYFPGLLLGGRLSMSRAQVSTVPSVPVFVHSEAQDIQDALDGLGLESLEFGE